MAISVQHFTSALPRLQHNIPPPKRSAPLSLHFPPSRELPKSRRTPTHDIALADQLGIKFGAVEGEENIEVDA